MARQTQCRPKNEERPGKKLIFRAWKQLPDGTRVYARQYGMRAFPIWVDIEE